MTSVCRFVRLEITLSNFALALVVTHGGVIWCAVSARSACDATGFLETAPMLRGQTHAAALRGIFQTRC